MNEQVVIQRHASELVTNKVLRNTYMLLSMTLFFSAIMAAVSMSMQTGVMTYWVCFGLSIAMLFVTRALRNSPWGIVCVFAFTGLMGFSLGPILNSYLAAYSNGAQLIAMSMGGTGVIFFALSGYVLTTKKDMSFMGGMLFAGLLVIFIAAIANLFFQMPAVSLAISAAAILIFSGFILYDTSQIIHGGETNYIMATMNMYLNIFNLFVHLLNLLGALSGDD